MSILPSGIPEKWTADTIVDLIGRLIKLGLALATAVAVIYIIIGAFHYFTAFGSEEKAATAKKTITWAIVGVVVIVLSYVLVNEVWQIVTPEPLKVPDTTPGGGTIPLPPPTPAPLPIPTP